MFKNQTVAVVIPAFKVTNNIAAVINQTPEFVDFIIVVDDKCPDNSGDVAASINNVKVEILRHKTNKGVGGATITGYKRAIKLQANVIVKMDGDGQMNPKYIKPLITPIINNQADYTKGNRFSNFVALRQMPKIRLFGNSILSFWVKLSSGYWNIMDATNGYTAINSKIFARLDLTTIANRYFFESDMLINLNIENAVVQDIAIPASYGEETSSLSIGKVIISFPYKLSKGLLKRLFYKYFIYDFNMASVYMTFGIPMVSFGVLFGAWNWYYSSITNIDTSLGTIMLSVLPVILGVQFLLQAIAIDIANTPKNNNV